MIGIDFEDVLYVKKCALGFTRNVTRVHKAISLNRLKNNKMLQSQNKTPRTCKADVDDGQQETTRVGTDIDVARYKKTVSLQCKLGANGISTLFLTVAMQVYNIELSETCPTSLALGWQFTLSILKLNYFLNPFLYCWKIRGVRQIIAIMFCLLKLAIPLA